MSLTYKLRNMYRAFASLKDMTDWCHHLPKENGYFYALKGIYHEDEVQELDKKFEVKDVITLHVPIPQRG